MRQRFSPNREAPYLILLAAILGGFLFVASPANAATVYISGDVTSTATWVASNVYVITNSTDVDSGITLTIASGTVVKFATGGELAVDGSLLVNGAPSANIYFTSLNDNSIGGTIASSTGAPAPGDWAGVFIDSGSSSTISNAVIRYGGDPGCNCANLEQTGGTLSLSNTLVASSDYTGIHVTNGAIATISSSTIRNNALYGINEDYGTGSLTLASNTFATNADDDAYVSYDHGISFSSWGNTDTATTTGTGYRGFYVLGTLSTTTATWNKDVPYITAGVTVASGTTLNINPGTIIKADQGAIDVTANGRLNIQGTSTNPVYFTSLTDDSVAGDTNADGASTTPQPGDGGFIEIDSGASSSITNMILRYGGASSPSYSNIYQTGGVLTASHITIASSSNYGFNITGGVTNLTTSTIENNESYGINESGSSGSLTLTSSTLINNGYYYSGQGNTYFDLGSGFNLIPSGNIASGTDAGFLVQGTLATSTTWFKDLPYIVGSGGIYVASGTTLTINHGAIVKLVSVIDVQTNGALNVQGTSTDKVYFTSLNDNSVGGITSGSNTSTPSPGDWLYIGDESGASSTINNAIISYGGYVSADGEIYMNGGKMNMTNSEVASSLDDGFNMDAGTTTVKLSEIDNNGHGGFYMTGGALSVTSSSIQGNAAYGVYNGDNVTSTAYAEDNWWGSATGPTNPTNASGTGDVASSYVDFTHWLTYPPVDGTTTLSALTQYKSDAATTLSEGSSTTESVVVFGANLQSLATSTESLQVEVKPAGTAFTNTVTVSSTYMTPGSNATATFPLPDTRESGGNGSFHWQARVVDGLGDASGWQLFGPNASSTDFKIDTIPLYTQVTSTYPSNSNTTGTAWWAPQLLDNIATNTIANFGCAITSVVMDLRSYGITTASSSHASSTDVNPGNINDWLENFNTSTASSGYASGGLLNWQDIPYYSETPSGTFRVWYQDTGNTTSSDHLSVESSTWVNYWLNYSATATVPVILTIPTSSSLTIQHFVVATGFAVDPLNHATSTYTLRDPYFFNTMYSEQATTTTSTHDYANTYQGAHVFTPTSTTVLPLYLEYEIDSAHTLLIADPSGNRLGIDSTTGVSYNSIPNSGEDDDESGVRFLTIYTPATGRYTLTVGGLGTYHLESFVADGKHMPIPQVISSSTPSISTVIYHQDYDSTNLPASTVQP